MMKRLLQGLLCAAALAASSSLALAADWTIARLTGAAWILAEGTEPVAAASGMVVPKGSTVSTGRNGRVMLVHGKDTVLVGPGTLVGVPYRPDRGVSTTLVQQIGEVELAIEKRGRPHFSVQTPFLAAVVKGTEFAVLVSEQDATVRVDGGLVAVQDLRSGERADIAAGQSATATRGGAGLSVSGKHARPEVRAGRPQQAAVPALSGGTKPDAGKGNGGNGGSAGGNNGNGNGGGSNAGGNGNGNNGNGNGNGGGDGSNAGGNGNGNNGNGNGNGGGDGSNAGGNGNGNNGSGINPGGNGNHGNGNNGNGNGNGGGDGSNAGGNGNHGDGSNGNGHNGNNGNGNGGGSGSSSSRDDSGSGRVSKRLR